MWQNYLNKAQENIAIARIGFDRTCYNASASRAYFAGFHASIAILLQKNFRREKFDHKWVQAEFSEKLIKRQKIFPNKFKSYLIEMQLLRNVADYDGDPVSQKAAARCPPPISPRHWDDFAVGFSSIIFVKPRKTSRPGTPQWRTGRFFVPASASGKANRKRAAIEGTAS